MRVYFEVAKCAFRRYATYRAATAAGAFTNTVWGFIRAYIFIALWKTQSNIGGYGVSDAITFVFLSQALTAPLSMFGLSLELPDRIRTGDVVSDLQRPVDFQGWWLAADVGRASYQLIGRVFPFLVGALAFDLRIPAEPGQWAAFVLAVYLGIVVSFAIRYLIALAVWWLKDPRGLNTAAALLMLFMSGMIVPLVLLPGWIGTVAQVLPWSGVLQVPADVFLGMYSGAGTIRALAFQAGWAIVILALGRFLTFRARHVTVAQGG